MVADLLLIALIIGMPLALLKIGVVDFVDRKFEGLARRRGWYCWTDNETPRIENHEPCGLYGPVCCDCLGVKLFKKESRFTCPECTRSWRESEVMPCRWPCAELLVDSGDRLAVCASHAKHPSAERSGLTIAVRRAGVVCMADADNRGQESHSLARWHQAIGNFVVSFEQACLAARSFVLWYLPGSSHEEQQRKVTVLEKLDAQQLADIVRDLLVGSGRYDQEAESAVESFLELVKVRSMIVQSPWFAHDGSPREPRDSALTMFSPSAKKGPHRAASTRELKLGDLHEQIVRADNVKAALLELHRHGLRDLLR